MRFSRVQSCMVFLTAAAYGQQLTVYSEFQRVRPDGEIVQADRVVDRREFISPAVVRGGYLTLRLAIQAPKGMNYTLYIGQNPEGVARCRLLQERHAKVGEEWAPVSAAQVEMPHTARLSPDEAVQTYLLDIQIPANTKPQRFRLEAQLNVGERWVIYPMEIRVRDLAVQPVREPRASGGPPLERSDAVALDRLAEFVCGVRSGTARQLNTITAITARNISQDLLIAQSRAKDETLQAVRATLMQAGGYESAEKFCESPRLSPKGAEWWLKARDYLYQGIPIH